MGQLTTFAGKKILDHLLKVASYSPPSAVYIGLSTADPGATGSGWANPTYTGYGRQAINFEAAASRSIANSGAVTFAPCSGGSSVCTYWGIWDAPTGGNLLAYATLASGQTVTTGKSIRFPIGGITVGFSAGTVFTGIANSILDWLFRAQTLGQPTHVNIGLSTTTPTDAGANITEPSGGSYARKAGDTWNAASGNPEASTNNGEIDMATPTGAWGDITHVVLYLDTTPFLYGVTTNQNPNSTKLPKWASGSLSCSIQ